MKDHKLTAILEGKHHAEQDDYNINNNDDDHKDRKPVPIQITYEFFKLQNKKCAVQEDMRLAYQSLLIAMASIMMAIIMTPDMKTDQTID